MACTDMAIRLEGDGLAMGSSASKKSRSLELLLTLHTVVGRHWVRRTTGGSRPARARCAMRPPIDAVQAHMVWRCIAEGDGLNSLRTEPASRPPRMCRRTSIEWPPRGRLHVCDA